MLNFQQQKNRDKDLHDLILIIINNKDIYFYM